MFSIALPTVGAVLLGTPLYFLAAALPAGAVVAYALGSTRESRHGVPARMLYGGCVATTIAMFVELAVFVVLAVMAYGALSSTVGGRESLEVLMESITAASEADVSQAAAEQAVMDALMAFLRQPIVLLAAFAMLGVLGPLIEELAKVGVVAVRAPGRRARAWVWGVAAGAGFGAVEAVALSTMAFGAWPLSMTLRAGATLMHATTTGVAALGVYALVKERRPGFAFAALAAAVLAHAGWNSLVLLAAVGGPEDSSGYLSGLAIALLGGLLAVIAMAFARLSRSVADEAEEQPTADEAEEPPVSDEAEEQPAADEGETQAVADDGEEPPVSDEGETHAVADEGEMQPAADGGEMQAAVDEGETHVEAVWWADPEDPPDAGD